MVAYGRASTKDECELHINLIGHGYMSVAPMQVFYFVVAVCALAQIIMLSLQWRAYRTVRHGSLVWLMAGAALALVFYIIEAIRYVLVTSGSLRWDIYLLSLPVMLVSIATGIYGTALLLRAFTVLAASEKVMDRPGSIVAVRR
jgi:hypothetical protein